MSQVTVAQLIEILKQMSPDALVQAEGCDCYGECTGAEVITGGPCKGEVLITRR
jgi:hypothetical protein